MRPGRSAQGQALGGPAQAGRPAATHLADSGGATTAAAVSGGERRASAPGERPAERVRDGDAYRPRPGARRLADRALRGAIRSRRGGTGLDIDGRVMSNSMRAFVEHARNHPLWLRRRLPTNARIEFDAMSGSDEGDLKVELWGDGRSAADSVSYNDATSYLTIFGGWKNSFHVLARINEHAPDRPEIRLDENSDDLRARKVEKGRSYHFKVTRDDGHTVRWLVDDLEILTYPDPKPLLGPGHDHFGFNDWDVRACFDNLTVTPLPGGGGTPPSKQELR